MAAGRVLHVSKDLSSLTSAGLSPAFFYLRICSAVLLVRDEDPIGRIELSRTYR